MLGFQDVAAMSLFQVCVFEHRISSSFEVVKPAAPTSIALARAYPHWLAKSKTGDTYLEQQLTVSDYSLSVSQCARWLPEYR